LLAGRLQDLQRALQSTAHRKPPDLNSSNHVVCDEKLVLEEKYAGRLRHKYANWKSLTDDETILEIIQGYKLNFNNSPTYLHRKHNPNFSITENKFTNKEVQRLLGIGAIESTYPEKDEFISSIFVVPKPYGGFRLILNLKDLNNFISSPHFKMEDFRTVRTLMKENSYMATVDLKDAYLLVPIYENSRRFLRFSFNGILGIQWSIDGSKNIY